MNKLEITEILTYLAVDFEKEITPNLVTVWGDQFGHVPVEAARAAARLCLARKSYGFPKVHEFHEALAEVLTPESDKLEWGSAWDIWVQCAARGRYNHAANMARYSSECPLGAQALGTMGSEYYDLDVGAMGPFRAHFRQRYEGLQRRRQETISLSPRHSLPSPEKPAIEAANPHNPRRGKPAEVDVGEWKMQDLSRLTSAREVLGSLQVQQKPPAPHSTD